MRNSIVAHYLPGLAGTATSNVRHTTDGRTRDL